MINTFVDRSLVLLPGHLDYLRRNLGGVVGVEQFSVDFGEPVTRDVEAFEERIHLIHVLVRQLNLESVFLDTLDASGTRNGDDLGHAGPTGKSGEPVDRKPIRHSGLVIVDEKPTILVGYVLRGGATLLGRPLLDLFDKLDIVVKVFGLEARHLPEEYVKVFWLLDLACEKSSL